MENIDVRTRGSLDSSRPSQIAGKTCLFLSICIALLPSFASGRWPECHPIANEPTSPLEHFGKLVADSWTVTAQTGRKMQHTWKWGPGKQSIERWTEGESAQGAPWKELIVYYWQPSEKRVRFLGISPYSSGISQGTMDFDGKDAVANCRLAQVRGVRELQIRWHFKNADCYQETLLEKDADGKLTELVSFEHLREHVDAKAQTKVTATPAVIREELTGLEFLLGNAWEGKLDGDSEASLSTAIDWIPHANTFVGRITEQAAGSDSSLFANFYVYFDTESKSVRCLIVTSKAKTYEGQVRQMLEGSLQVDLKSASTDEIAIVQTSLRKPPQIVFCSNCKLLERKRKPNRSRSVTNGKHKLTSIVQPDQVVKFDLFLK